MHTLRIVSTFSWSDARRAIAAVLFETLVKRYARGFWIVVGFSVLSLVVAALSEPGTSVAGVGELISRGLAVVVCTWGILLLLIFFLNARSGRQAFANRVGRSATYEISKNGCAVSSENCKWNVSWDSFARLSYFPGIWLLEFNEPRASSEIEKSFTTSLNSSQSIVAAQENAAGGQPIDFPVFWIKPIPIRRYLVLLAKDIGEEQIAFLRRMIQRKE